MKCIRFLHHNQKFINQLKIRIVSFCMLDISLYIDRFNRMLRVKFTLLCFNCNASVLEINSNIKKKQRVYYACANLHSEEN